MDFRESLEVDGELKDRKETRMMPGGLASVTGEVAFILSLLL